MQLHKDAVSAIKNLLKQIIIFELFTYALSDATHDLQVWFNFAITLGF
jgi:hypothetical protein